MLKKKRIGFSIAAAILALAGLMVWMGCDQFTNEVDKIPENEPMEDFTENTLAPAGPATITGALTAKSESRGGRDFSFTNLGSTKISLKALIPTETEEASERDGLVAKREKITMPLASGPDVGTVAISGGRYSISGVPAGTYRLTAEDPTGLYDFVDNNVVVPEEGLEKNMELTVFRGLKLTVRIKPGDSPSKYKNSFVLPIRCKIGQGGVALSEDVTINLDVDWGDGSTSHLTDQPENHQDPRYTHYYTGALGDSTEKDFVIRMKGDCYGNGGNENVSHGYGYGTLLMGYYTAVYRNGSGQTGGTGYWHYGNKDKMVRAAGNISALIENAKVRKNVYQAMFYDCKKLEDISGLAFTEEGDWGEGFLSLAFASHSLTPGSALKTIPATLLPLRLTNFTRFLSQTFLYSGLETIPENFLPDNVPNDTDNFLFQAFMNSKVKAIPANFIPSGITYAGDYFLNHTFQGCNIERIPDNFLANITSVGKYFLFFAFGENKIKTVPDNFLVNITSAGSFFLGYAFDENRELKTIPTNFFPRNLSSMGAAFLGGVFWGTGITEVPADFIPAKLPPVKDGFLYLAFSNCKDLVSADISSFTGYTTEAYEGAEKPDIVLMEHLFVGCSSLKTLKLSSYRYGKMNFPFGMMLSDGVKKNAAGDKLEIYIYGDEVLEYGDDVLERPTYNGIPMFYAVDESISRVYVKASLIDSYKKSEFYKMRDWKEFYVGINPDKFAPLPQ